MLIRERLQAVHVFLAIGFYDYLDIGDIANVVCDVGDATVVDAVIVELAMVVARNLRFQPSQVFSQLLQLCWSTVLLGFLHCLRCLLRPA